MKTVKLLADPPIGEFVQVGFPYGEVLTIVGNTPSCELVNEVLVRGGSICTPSPLYVPQEPDGYAVWSKSVFATDVLTYYVKY